MSTPGEWDVPPWLLDALASRPAAPRRLLSPHADVARGEVRVAQAGDVRELVVVETVEPESQYVVAILVTNEVDLATESDLILSPGDTGLGYAVAVVSAVRGALWISQLGPALGRLSDDDLEAIRTVQHWPTTELAEPTEHPSALPRSSRRGMPLLGSDDPRWSFKSELVDVMRILSASATRALVVDDLSDRETVRTERFAAAVDVRTTAVSSNDEELIVNAAAHGEKLRILAETPISRVLSLVEVPFAIADDARPLLVALFESRLGSATGEIVIDAREARRLASAARLVSAADLDADAAEVVAASIVASTPSTRAAWLALLDVSDHLDALVMRAITKATQLEQEQ